MKSPHQSCLKRINAQVSMTFSTGTPKVRLNGPAAKPVEDRVGRFKVSIRFQSLSDRRRPKWDRWSAGLLARHTSPVIDVAISTDRNKVLGAWAAPIVVCDAVTMREQVVTLSDS